MAELFKLLCSAVIGLFQSRASLEAENVALRHRTQRVAKTIAKAPDVRHDRSPNLCGPLSVCAQFPRNPANRRPRDGNPLASRRLSPVVAMEITLYASRPKAASEIRQLIHQDRAWPTRYGALHAFMENCSSSGSTLVKPRSPNTCRRAQTTVSVKTSLRDHTDGIVAMDLFVVPTLSFRLLYGLLIMGHGTTDECCGWA